jgi:hypothetical protein
MSNYEPGSATDQRDQFQQEYATQQNQLVQQKKKKRVWLIGVAAVVAILVIYSFSAYNGLSNSREDVTGQRSNIDSLLQRRNDLIPNLVATVKADSKQEKDLIGEITEARARLGGARLVAKNHRFLGGDGQERGIVGGDVGAGSALGMGSVSVVKKLLKVGLNAAYVPLNVVLGATVLIDFPVPPNSSLRKTGSKGIRPYFVSGIRTYLPIASAAEWVGLDLRRGGLTILDFGCGGGYLRRNLKCRLRLGVEVNPDAARVAGLPIQRDVFLAFVGSGSGGLQIASLGAAVLLALHQLGMPLGWSSSHGSQNLTGTVATVASIKTVGTKVSGLFSGLVTALG